LNIGVSSGGRELKNTTHNLCNYIVTGSGRVGGHLLKGIILTTGNTAEHNHDPVPDINSILCISDRRNVFDAVMSNLLVKQTDQTFEYHKDVDPFTASLKDFKILLSQHLNFYKNISTQGYKEVYYFYFEDFVTNPECVYNKLGILPVNSKNVTMVAEPFLNAKCPYQYKDKILNWHELYDFFLKQNLGTTCINTLSKDSNKTWQ